MPLFASVEEYSAEALTIVADQASGLKALIAIHSTRRGPAFGGIRTLSYRSDAAAVTDALRLAEAMTLKAAAADLPAGGGKAVVIKHSGLRRAKAFEALGRAVERLRGLFYTGLDVGTVREDLLAVASRTRYVARDLNFGRASARGVLAAVRAALQHTEADASVAGRRIAIQGLGAVGMELAQMLDAEGADLLIADTNARLAAELGEQLGCQVISSSRILAANVDVFCPCALGGILTLRSAESMRCHVVAGSANNQLARPEVGQALTEAGIVWVPDFVANAGALIKGVREFEGGQEVGFEVVDQIYDTTLEILQQAEARGATTLEIAMNLARERLK